MSAAEEQDEEQNEEQDEESWRSRLSRRLALLAAGLAPIVVTPIALGTTSGVAQSVLLTTTAVLSVGLLVLARRGVPERTRSVGVVVAFLATGTVGYATLGFLSAPGVAVALAIACAGLLLDRRAMAVTLAICVLCLGVVGTLMVTDVLPAPLALDISPERAGPWVRSSVITLVLLAILGAAVSLVVGILEDSIDRVEEAGRRRREAERQALHAQSTQLIGQLAASLAHDLNNQLTVIGWWSGVLAREVDDEERRRAADVVAQSIDQATTLTRRLLMAGRRDTPISRPVHLVDFLSASEPLLRGLVPPEIELVVVADERPWIRIDPSRLSHVLMNLAVNARDAMPDGGTLTIEARLETQQADGEDDERNPALPGGDRVGDSVGDRVGEWVRLSVTDDGVGMDDETRQRSLEPFFTTKSVDRGTGLGLTAAEALTEQAGGRLRIVSSPGCGTRVHAWFPAVGPEPPSGAADARDPQRLDGVGILLVEDSPDVLDVARRTLLDAGATVIGAVDGDDALHKIDGSEIDVLCTDVVMPGVPVSEVIRRFGEAHPGGVTLLCSGYVGEELVRRGIEEGRYRLLRKPYRPAELLEAIGGALAVATSGSPATADG